jgi:hypothetical protein
LEARGRNEPQEGSKKPFFHGDKGKKIFKGNGRKRERKSHVNNVQRMVMMKTIVGKFILKRDPKISSIRGNQRLL